MAKLGNQRMLFRSGVAFLHIFDTIRSIVNCEHVRRSSEPFQN